jgi:hypothetical protein
LGIGLAIGAMIILVSLYLRVLPSSVSIEAWLASLGLAGGALACAFWEPLAQFLTEHGNGEPIALLQGVSVWPTVLLRSLGIVLAIYLTWQAQRSLHNNLESIGDELRLDMTAPGSHDLRSLWTNIVAAFDYSTGNGKTAHWPRVCRAVSYSAVICLIVTLFVVPLFGNPSIPARGALAASAYFCTTFLCTLLMVFLTCFVFDATYGCLHFVRKLRRAKCKWPAETTSLFNGRLQLQEDVVRDWINLELVARRTRCIGSLIYYPFVLIALLAVTSSTAFANYPPNLSSFIAVGASLAVVIACAIVLYSEANTGRATAKHDLVNATLSAEATGPITLAASEALSKTAQQLELLLRHVDQMSEGAFGPFLAAAARQGSPIANGRFRLDSSH